MNRSKKYYFQSDVSLFTFKVISLVVVIGLISFSSLLFAFETTSNIRSKGFETATDVGIGSSYTDVSNSNNSTFSIVGNRLFSYGSGANIWPPNFSSDNRIAGIQLLGAKSSKGQVTSFLHGGSVAIGPGAQADAAYGVVIGSYNSFISGTGNSGSVLPNAYSFIAGATDSRIATIETRRDMAILGGVNNSINNGGQSAIIGGKYNIIQTKSQYASSVILAGLRNEANFQSQVIAGAFNNDTVDASNPTKGDFSVTFGYGTHPSPDGVSSDEKNYLLKVGVGVPIAGGIGGDYESPPESRSTFFLVTEDKAYAISWVALSDRRLKEEIIPYQAGLKEILALNPVKFKWKRLGREDFGLIAQEVNEVLPEIVYQSEVETADSSKEVKDHWGLYYEKISVVLINAIKEHHLSLIDHQSQIEKLQQRVEELQKK